MREDFVHYIWKLQKWKALPLYTSDGGQVDVLATGIPNQVSGPDFFNAQLIIDRQRWAGNVEIHVRSSDWYVHNHQIDPAYDSVILHVVWEHDTEVLRKDGTAIPVLEVSEYIPQELKEKYQRLFTKTRHWIPCEGQLNTVDKLVIDTWLERLYVERLQQKAEAIQGLLDMLHNDWEAVFFVMLMRGFGTKVNGEAMESIARSFDFSVLRKVWHKLLPTEALLMGQAGLLQGEIEEGYFQTLGSTYRYLSNKFSLSNDGVLPLKFFRLRPANFPTMRLAQLASLYAHHGNLFSKILEVRTASEVYALLNVEVSKFWKNHYSFTSISPRGSKKLTKEFSDLLIINTIAPMRFCYAQYMGEEISEELISLLSALKPEKNTVIDKYGDLGVNAENALHTQALLQLKASYCDAKRCLQCRVGHALVGS